MDILRRFKFCPVCGSPHFSAASAKSLRCADCGFEYFINAAAAYVAVIYDTRGRMLVVRRSCEPARGTLDLPGGFADMGETAEEGLAREVMEETGLRLTHCRYLFSHPNRYLYSGIIVPTLDLFFECHVESTAEVRAADDAAEAFWMDTEDICPDDFGLDSIREGVKRIINHQR